MHVVKWKYVQTFVQHRHSNHTHGTLKIKTAISTTAFLNKIISLEKRPWLLHCKHIATWSKFLSSVGLKIKFSTCWQGRCVCITAEPLYLPARHCHCTCCSPGLVQFLGLVWTRDENTLSLSPWSSFHLYSATLSWSTTPLRAEIATAKTYCLPLGKKAASLGGKKKKN